MRIRIIVPIIGLCLLTAACKSQPKGQIVAIVNGEEITASELSLEIAEANAPDSVNQKTLRTTVLQRIINRKLMVQRAREEGLDKTDEFLRQKQDGSDDLLADALGHMTAEQVPLPDDRDVQQYIANHPVQFAQRQRLVLDQLRFAPPKDRRKLDVLKNAHSLDASIAALQSIGITPVRGAGAIDTGTTDPAVIAGILQAPAGEPILLPQGNDLIVGVITGREPLIAPTRDQTVAAARAVRAVALLRESEAQIARAREKAKITYEPGFEVLKPVAKPAAG